MSTVWDEAAPWLVNEVDVSRAEQDRHSEDLDRVVGAAARNGSLIDQLAMLLREAGLAVAIVVATLATLAALAIDLGPATGGPGPSSVAGGLALTAVDRGTLL